MPIILRSYNHPADFSKIGDFLLRSYQPGNAGGNWLQPAWAYMHSHPNLDESALGQIGIWEDSGRIVGVATFESSLGEAFFQLDPGYTHLKPAMLAYAQEHLRGISGDGAVYLQAYAADIDQEFAEILQSAGCRRVPENDRPMSTISIPESFPATSLPDGFCLKSLAEENDLHKINRVLWRGFNHLGEPPEDLLPGRVKMQAAAGFRPDLNIVVQAPGGEYGAYAGTWFEPVNRYAYVEPVAADPQYRRLGLGKAAVLEGIRRCKVEGAELVYVGSDLEFYRSMGFEKVFAYCCWEKQL